MLRNGPGQSLYRFWHPHQEGPSLPTKTRAVIAKGWRRRKGWQGKGTGRVWGNHLLSVWVLCLHNGTCGIQYILKWYSKYNQISQADKGEGKLFNKATQKTWDMLTSPVGLPTHAFSHSAANHSARLRGFHWELMNYNLDLWALPIQTGNQICAQNLGSWPFFSKEVGEENSFHLQKFINEKLIQPTINPSAL